MAAGGGIGGLTQAIALTKSMRDYDQHIHIDIYEAAQEFTEIGAGVALFRRPLRIMQAIGMLDDLKLLTEIAEYDEEGDEWFHLVLPCAYLPIDVSIKSR